MMKKTHPFILLSIMSGISYTASAGVVVGSTRVVYSGADSEALLSVKNNNKNTSELVQAWVSHIDDRNTSKTPFVITPPLAKLEAQRETLLHFVFIGTPSSLPQDRESVFWANIKSISATPEGMKNQSKLQIAVKNRIKLFYRPVVLNDKQAQSAYQKLQFQKYGSMLQVNNPTPFYVTLSSLTVGGEEVRAPTGSTPAVSMMIPPFGESRFPLDKTGSTVNWSTIGDYGGVTKTLSQSLK